MQETHLLETFDSDDGNPWESSTALPPKPAPNKQHVQLLQI
jgi:hypothetical protein